MNQRPEIWLVVHREELVAELSLTRAEIRLLRPDGQDVPGFLLHIDGSRASWRCWDLPADVRFEQQLNSFERRLWNGPREASARIASRAFGTVSGSWTQPAARCDQPGPTYSAFWVGLGGFKRGSQELEQIGSESDCTANGAAPAYTWYEIVPAPPVRLPLAVHHGDRLIARVTVRGQVLVLGIEDLSTHRSFSRTVRIRSRDASSAEWIAEAPSQCFSSSQCQPLPLTDFGNVGFTSATARLPGERAGTISAPSFTTTELTLAGGAPPIGPMPIGFPVAARGAARGAVPSPLAASGTSFTVTVNQERVPPGGPPPLAAPDRLRHGKLGPVR
jgi:hypothetical protein